MAATAATAGEKRCGSIAGSGCSGACAAEATKSGFARRYYGACAAEATECVCERRCDDPCVAAAASTDACCFERCPARAANGGAAAASTDACDFERCPARAANGGA